MNTRKSWIVASAALASFAAVASEQEMGEVESAPAKVIATGDSIAAVSEAVEKDEGPKIVEAEQSSVPAEVAVTDAKSKILEWVTKKGYTQGFDEGRGYILQIGDARDNSLDPMSEDFMTKREMLYREAQLRAKIEICGVIDREAGATNAKVGLSADEVKAFEEKNARAFAELNEMNRKVARLMIEMEVAETADLKGVTTADRLNALVDRIIRRLDKSYDAGQIAAEKRAKYETVKATYERAKVLADELEAKKRDLFPDQTLRASIDSAVRIKLHGAVTLHQYESYVGREYQVAVAVIWSPKLQDRAVAMLSRRPLAAGKPTAGCTLREYLVRNRAALAAMVGQRQFVDKDGKLYFLGIAAQQIPEDAVEKDENMTFANQMAIQAVLTSLYVEGSGITAASATLAKRKRKSGEMMKTLVDNMDEATPKGMHVSGLSNVYSAEVEHPILRKPVYVSVAAIDATLAARAPAIQRIWDAQAVNTVRTLREIAGERQGAEDALDAAKRSNEDFNRGRARGRSRTEADVKVLRGENGVEKTTVVPAGTASEGKSPVRAQQGVFGGTAPTSDDF